MKVCYIEVKYHSKGFFETWISWLLYWITNEVILRSHCTLILQSRWCFNHSEWHSSFEFTFFTLHHISRYLTLHDGYFSRVRTEKVLSLWPFLVGKAPHSPISSIVFVWNALWNISVWQDSFSDFSPVHFWGWLTFTICCWQPLLHELNVFTT